MCTCACVHVVYVGLCSCCVRMAYLKHGLIFCILEGWLSLIRRSFTSDNNYSQCCNYPACISININNPFISNDHQIIRGNYNAISDYPRTNMPLFCITETEPSKMHNIRPCVLIRSWCTCGACVYVAYACLFSCCSVRNWPRVTHYG